MRTAAYTGFSGMLAEEYILIDISFINGSPGWTDKAQQQNITSSVLTLPGNGSGGCNTEYQHAEDPDGNFRNRPCRYYLQKNYYLI